MPDSSRKRELYDYLVKKIEELGRKPSFEEMRDDKSMPMPNDYAYYFGSFTQATEEAWEGYIRSKKSSTTSIIKKPIKQ